MNISISTSKDRSENDFSSLYIKKLIMFGNKKANNILYSLDIDIDRFQFAKSSILSYFDNNLCISDSLKSEA